MNETTTVANLDELGIVPGNVEKESWLDCLAEGIDDLPVTERLIISLFYYEGLTIQEIALVLEMAEPEVSKIHYDTVLELLKR
jgi:RNA polymerase sigma factor for flagellar operon FliA